MCMDHEIPIIELHDLTGEPVGLRRDTIALVKAASGDEYPLGGSLIFTDTLGVHVIETPGEVLAAVRAEVVAVVDLADPIASDAAGSA